MKLVVDLNELEIGDWVRVYPKDKSKRYYKIGEITHKWLENGEPRFQLKIVETNLPNTTENLMEKFLNIQKNRKKIVLLKRDLVYKLTKKEKDKMIKRNILDELR